MSTTYKWVGFEMPDDPTTRTYVQEIHGTKYSGQPLQSFIENNIAYRLMNSLDGTPYLCTQILGYETSQSGIFTIDGSPVTKTTVDFVPADGGLPPNP